MGVVALITWFTAMLAGLYMLAVWLIENDVTGPVRTSRLPPPVIFTHLFLAATGLTVWAGYLFLHQKDLAWAACGILLCIAVLGLTMFLRWIPVYRGPADSVQAPAASQLAYEMPAEGHFPVVLVGFHGVLAVTTLVLVVLTTLGIGH